MPAEIGRPAGPPVSGRGTEVLNSVTPDVDSWTEIDIAAEYPAGETPESARMMVVLGYDASSGVGGLVDIRFRKKGDTTDFENAQGLSGHGRLIELDGSSLYLSGGLVQEINVPVSVDGKFEYQLSNRGGSPRSILKLQEVSTSENFQTIRVPKIWNDADVFIANTTATVDLIELPAGAVVQSVIAVLVTPWSGGGLSTCVAECGQDVGPDPNAYLVSFDATAVANTIYGGADAHVGADLDGAANAIYSVTATMKVQAVITADVNLNLATAGEVDFYITYRRLPL